MGIGPWSLADGYVVGANEITDVMEAAVEGGIGGERSMEGKGSNSVEAHNARRMDEDGTSGYVRVRAARTQVEMEQRGMVRD